MKPAENCLKKYFYAVSLNRNSILFLEFYSFMLITTPSLFFYSRHDNCQEQNLSIQGSRLSRIWSPFLLTTTITATRCFFVESFKHDYANYKHFNFTRSLFLFFYPCLTIWKISWNLSSLEIPKGYLISVPYCTISQWI